MGRFETCPYTPFHREMSDLKSFLSSLEILKQVQDDKYSPHPLSHILYPLFFFWVGIFSLRPLRSLRFYRKSIKYHKGRFETCPYTHFRFKIPDPYPKSLFFFVPLCQCAFIEIPHFTQDFVLYPY
jgi:hypothetical protein